MQKLSDAQSFLDLARYVQQPASSPVVEQKKAQVQEASLAKQAIYGSPQEQRVLATAQDQGIKAVVQDESMRDLDQLDLISFAAKHGIQAALDRGSFYAAQSELSELKRRERSGDQVGTDWLNKGANLAVSGVGNIANMGVTAYDVAETATNKGLNKVIESLGGEPLDIPEPLSPKVAEAIGKTSEWFRGKESQTSQERRVQHALEGQLMEAENEVEAQARLEAALQEEGAWERSIKPYLQNKAAEYGDTIKNYADDPLMAADLIPEMVGSMAPMIAGTAALGGGRAIATTLMAGMEGGAAVTQTQQEILGMSEAQLSESTDYVRLRKDGATHEQARDQLAMVAGAVAGATSLPLAVGAGYLAAPLAMNPLGLGAKGLVGRSVNLGQNVGREAFEETIQEGNSQFANNVGMRTSDFDVALDRNVASAAAEGTLGGMVGTGAMQAPAAALGLAGDGAVALGGLASKGIKARNASLDAKRDATSVVGSAAQVQAAAEMKTAGEALIADLTPAAPQTEAGQTEPAAPAAPSVTQEAVAKALYLTDDEVQNQSMIFPGLAEMKAAAPDGKVERLAVLAEADRVLSNSETSEQHKIFAALEALHGMDDMRQIDSDAVKAEIGGLDASSPARQNYDTLTRNLQIAESAGTIAKAEKVLGSLTPEAAQGLIPLALLDDPNLPDATRMALARAVETISRVNPDAYKAPVFDMVLAQIGSGKNAEELKKKLEAAKTIAEEFARADESREKIRVEHDAAQAKRGKKSSYRPWDLVRKDIETNGNENNKMLSLAAHRRLISTEGAAGRLTAAQDLLGDLVNFGVSQINKLGAYNQNIAAGTGREGAVSFTAHGPFGSFPQKGVWVDVTNPRSVAMAKEVEIDTQAAVALAKTLAQTYGLALPEGFDVPALALGGEVTTTSAPAKAAAPTPAPKAKKARKPKAKKAAKRPLIDMIKAMGGVKPSGKFGRELRARGILPKDAPGLFTKDGRADFDNLSAEEYPFLAQELGEDDNGYLNEEGILEAILSEIGGTPQDVTQEDADQRYAEEQEAEYQEFLAEEKAKAEEAAKAAEPSTAPAAPARLSAPAPKAITDQTTQETEETSEEAEERVEEGMDAELIDEIGQDEPPLSLPAPVAKATEVTLDAEGNKITAVDHVTPWFNSLKQTLVQSAENGVNALIDNFRPKKGASSLAAHEDPAAFILDNLGGLVGPETALQRELTTEEEQAITDLLEVTKPSFEKTFHDNMAAMSKEKGLNPRLMKREENVLFYPNTRPFNALAENDEGKLRVEPRIMAAVFMAAQDWVIQNASRAGKTLDDERVARMFGLPRGSRITEEMREGAQYGVPMQRAVEQIATAIEDLLGLKAIDSEKLKVTQGMFRSLAANALEAMMSEELEANAGLIQTRMVKYRGKNPATNKYEPRRMMFMRVNPNQAEDSSIRNLQKIGSPFAQIFVPSHEKQRLVDEKPERVKDTQLGNKFAKVKDKVTQVLKRLQGMENYINEPMFDFVDAIGGAHFADVLGFQEITDEKRARTNKMHLAQIEGKNNSIKRALEQVQLYVDEADLVANGRARGAVPIFFRWALSSVGRLQQEGPITPQGDKIAREIISSTNSVLDLTNADHVEALWLAIAQSLGIKVEQMSAEEATIRADFMLNDPDGPLFAAAELAQQWVEGTLENAESFGADFAKALKESGEAVTPKLIHAILTLARYNAAPEGETEFKTALALEADGKTDGPINAMMHMMTGKFSWEEIQRLAKGGLFFTDTPTSLSEFIAAEYAKIKKEKRKKGEDLYHLAAKKLESWMSISRAAEASEGMQMMRVLDALLPGFTLGEPDADGVFTPTVERNVVKNPLTVFLYGSGVSGIADKLTGEMLDTLYLTLTEAAEAMADGTMDSVSQHPIFAKHPTLFEDLKTILGVDLDTVLGDPVNAELNRDAFEKLSAQVEAHFAEPMLLAVDQVTGGLASRMKTTQLASQIQALVVQDLYNKALKAQNAANGSDDTANLSQADLEETFINEMDMAMVVDTDDQSFHISAPQKTATDKAVSTTFKGQLKSTASYIRPSDASVKISPYTTIGVGDGQMMLNIYATLMSAFDRSLAVFDGVEMALDTIKEASGAINKAVWDAWMGTNVYASMAQGYGQMTARLGQEKFDALDLTTKAEIKRALGIREDDYELTLSDIQAVGTSLDEFAEEAEIRKIAVSRMATSTDHMATAQSPHAHAGEVVGKGNPLNYKAIAARLNKLMKQIQAEREKAAKAKAATPKTAGYAQAPNAELTAAIAKAGHALEGFPGVTWLTGAELLRLMTEKTGFSKDQKVILDGVLKGDGLFKEATYYFGTAAELEAARDYYHPDPNNTEIELGLTYTDGNVAFIANMAPETILHEMLHTRTNRVLRDHFANPASSPLNVQLAVNHLVQLVGEVRRLRPGLNKALDVLHSVLNQHEGQPAAQISELIAYALANQDLIELGQTQRTYMGLGRLVKTTMSMLKRLLGFRADQMPDNRLWSQIRWNTEVLVTDRTLHLDRVSTGPEMISSQLAEPLTDAQETRLVRTEAQFLNRLESVLDARLALIKAKGTETTDAAKEGFIKAEGAQLRKQGLDAAHRAMASGFRLSPRETAVYGAVYAAFTSGMRLDAGLVRQINSLLQHVLKTVDATALGNKGAVEEARAELQHKFLTGVNGMQTDSAGRTDMLASFMALALSSPELRDVLAQIQVPPVAELKWGTVDDWITSIGNMVMALLTRLSLKRPERTGALSKELDRLGDAISEAQADRRWMKALDTVGDKVEQANDFLAQNLGKASDKTSGWFAQKTLSAPNKVQAVTFGVAAFLAAQGSRDAAAARGDAHDRFMNSVEGWDSVRAVLNDLRGATVDNKALLRLTNIAKATIDKLRQSAREGTQNTLARAFTRKITRAEWVTMHALGSTDIMALGLLEARAVMGAPETLDARVAGAEEAIRAAAPKLADRYFVKAKALALYMNTGDNTSQSLLRNGRAIAHLFNEADRPHAKDVTDGLIEKIDRLVALYAYQGLPESSRTKLKELSQTQPAGMEMVTGLLASMRQMEREKRLPDEEGKAELSLYNAWSGWLPELGDGQTQVQVFEDSESGEKRQMGWTRIGDYKGDPNEGHKTRRGYYISTVAGKSTFRQGVAQTVHGSYSGVNVLSGRTLGDTTAGAIVGTRAKRLAAAVASAKPGSVDGLAPGMYLLPVFNWEGKIIAYERPMDRKMLEGLQKDRHMGRMLGVWAGRVLEEQAAHELNLQLLDTLKRTYDQAVKDGREKELINLADPDQKDPVIKDAWATLGYQFKADAQEVFGRANWFPVYRNQAYDAIGYRSASLTDPWTGVSRLPEGFQKAFKELATGIAGDNAFKYLRKIENGVQGFVSFAKTTIIVRSITLGLGNIASNMVHLLSLGVGPLKMASVGRRKLIEINAYARNKEQIDELQIQFAARVQDPKASRVLRARIEALEDANRHLSIWPLIEAGEFSTISEGLDEADVAIRNGKWVEYMEDAVDKLPAWAGSAVKNVAMTKDSAMFKGMNRMVQYGDFIAKAILYDHLMGKGQSERETLDRIMEEFVQYNRLPGRARDGLESLGLGWFWNYALRIQKVAVNTIRERPLSALLMMAGVGPETGIDSVHSGSLLGTVMDGSVGYKFGPSMGFNGVFMHPLAALAP